MSACTCATCRARDDRRYWRIVQHSYPDGYPSPLATRTERYGYGRTAVPKLGLPPVPEWVGEPTEWEGTT